MKLFLSLTLFLCFCFIGHAQDFPSKLLLSYSQQELDHLKQKDQEKFLLLAYAVEHAIYTGAFYASKHSGLDKIELETEVSNPSFTDFGFKITDVNQYFYWESRDKVLVVKSFWVLENEQKNKQR
tara:strand:+ start:1039 stop:1413 length:375 start_codon:yes stop_codon:yes gene_type:complete